MINFKLTNFLDDPEFNGLRFHMGAKLVANFTDRKIRLLDEDAIRQLGKEGIDISDFSQVKVEPDGTLSFNGKRVILYIRDVHEISEQQNLPRYHLSFCSTLETMTQAKRFNRYVIANRDDGLFSVNFIANSVTPQSDVKLNICQNCLDRLKWDGFAKKLVAQLRRDKVNNFKIKDFFEKYPKDLISNIPIYTSETAPLNDYTEDWGMISESIKVERGFKCEACNISIGKAHRKFLHAHHIDGQKNNNSKSNIEILCIRCHANEPMHGHVKSSYSYKEFESLFPT